MDKIIAERRIKQTRLLVTPKSQVINTKGRRR